VDEHAEAVKARARAHACSRLLLLGACVSWHALAHAQQPAPEPAQTGTSVAYLRLSDCDAPPWTREQAAELLRALALELRSDGVEQVHAAEAGTELTPLLELDVDCATTAEFALGARSAPGVELSIRRMDLRDVPEPLWPRALALALAELLRTSRRAASPATPPAAVVQADAGTQPSTSTADSPVAADAGENEAGDETSAPTSEAGTAKGATDTNAPPTSQAASRAPFEDNAGEQHDPEPRHVLSIAPNARWLPGSSDALYGAAIGWEWLRFGAGLNALFGRASDTLGATSFGLVHAVLSYQALHLRLGREVLSAGPALGAGITWASAGSSSSANGGSALLLSYEVGARLGVSHDFSRGLAGGLCLEVGYAHGPKLRADDRDLATLSGVFLGLGLRVSIGL
jgi:hypothetical protein